MYISSVCSLLVFYTWAQTLNQHPDKENNIPHTLDPLPPFPCPLAVSVHLQLFEQHGLIVPVSVLSVYWMMQNSGSIWSDRTMLFCTGCIRPSQCHTHCCYFMQLQTVNFYCCVEYRCGHLPPSCIPLCSELVFRGLGYLAQCCYGYWSACLLVRIYSCFCLVYIDLLPVQGVSFKRFLETLSPPGCVRFTLLLAEGEVLLAPQLRPGWNLRGVLSGSHAESYPCRPGIPQNQTVARPWGAVIN